MKRINGWLDLDDYFDNIMVQNNLNKIDLLERNYITASIYPGIHYWLEIDNESYYFKELDILESFIEVIVSECANFLGVDAVQYDLAIFKRYNGVISKSFKKDNCNYISGNEILYKYLNEENDIMLQEMGMNSNFFSLNDLDIELIDELNNLEIIWQAIEYYYRGQNIKIEPIMNKLVLYFIFNILIAQTDAMSQNWELEENGKEVSLVPYFDGEFAFNDTNIFQMFITTNFKDQYLNNYEILKEFLTVSSEEHINLFLEKYELFDIENFMIILENVEKKIGVEIPNDIKNIIIDNSYSLFY